MEPEYNRMGLLSRKYGYIPYPIRLQSQDWTVSCPARGAVSGRASSRSGDELSARHLVARGRRLISRVVEEGQQIGGLGGPGPMAEEGSRRFDRADLLGHGDGDPLV